MTDTQVAVVSDMTEQEARELTDRIASNVEGLWQLIGEAFERKAWVALGYGSWEHYTEGEFGMSRGQAYRLVDQARTVAALEVAAGVEPGTLGASDVSARAAADIKPDLESVAAEVSEATRGKPKAERPEIVRDVTKRARQRATANKRSPGASSPQQPRVPESRMQTTPIPPSLDQLLGALLKHPPIEARELSNNRWAKLTSWMKQATAVRNPVETPATAKRTTAKKSAPAKATAACKHPINRRIGDKCAECGETVK